MRHYFNVHRFQQCENKLYNYRKIESLQNKKEKSKYVTFVNAVTAHRHRQFDNFSHIFS